MMAVGTERKSTGTFTQPEGRREGGREGTSPHSNQNDLQIPATQTEVVGGGGKHAAP